MSEAEPPPPELLSLFEAERAAPRVDASAQAALRARLAESVAHAPLGQAAAGSLLGGAGKALAIVAIAIAAGAGTIAVIKHVEQDPPRAAAESPPPTAPHGIDAPTVPTDAPARRDQAAVEIPSTPVDAGRQLPTQHSQAPRIVASKQPQPQNVIPPSPSQPELLRRAWTALRAGDGARALAIAKEDEQLHRNGVLAEEREALEICALAKLDRLEEARLAAEVFFQQHPNSVHRTLIKRAMEEKVSQ